MKSFLLHLELLLSSFAVATAEKNGCRFQKRMYFISIIPYTGLELVHGACKKSAQGFLIFPAVPSPATTIFKPRNFNSQSCRTHMEFKPHESGGCSGEGVVGIVPVSLELTGLIVPAELLSYKRMEGAISPPCPFPHQTPNPHGSQNPRNKLS